ncbi:uncharacterized protein BJX67DRAFT_156416 [Aspergillus lucknowensis]|uniref:Uncharacterized protein n=1 Tax=Aspergillus lucknowensis TaxID=176173 RepID=A0ABR4LMQ2_9EURO
MRNSPNLRRPIRRGECDEMEKRAPGQNTGSSLARKQRLDSKSAAPPGPCGYLCSSICVFFPPPASQPTITYCAANPIPPPSSAVVVFPVFCLSPQPWRKEFHLPSSIPSSQLYLLRLLSVVPNFVAIHLVVAATLTSLNS